MSDTDRCCTRGRRHRRSNDLDPPGGRSAGHGAGRSDLGRHRPDKSGGCDAAARHHRPLPAEHDSRADLGGLRPGVRPDPDADDRQPGLGFRSERQPNVRRWRVSQRPGERRRNPDRPVLRCRIRRRHRRLDRRLDSPVGPDRLLARRVAERVGAGRWGIRNGQRSASQGSGGPRPVDRCHRHRFQWPGRSSVVGSSGHGARHQSGGRRRLRCRELLASRRSRYHSGPGLQGRSLRSPGGHRSPVVAAGDRVGGLGSRHRCQPQ